VKPNLAVMLRIPLAEWECFSFNPQT